MSLEQHEPPVSGASPPPTSPSDAAAIMASGTGAFGAQPAGGGGGSGGHAHMHMHGVHGRSSPSPSPSPTPPGGHVHGGGGSSSSLHHYHASSSSSRSSSGHGHRRANSSLAGVVSGLVTGLAISHHSTGNGTANCGTANVNLNVNANANATATVNASATANGGSNCTSNGSGGGGGGGGGSPGKMVGRYITNSGSVVQFDLGACVHLFGVACGSRVYNSKSKRSGTVIGVHSSRLWIHVDRDKGASMMPYKNKKQLKKSGWAPLSSYSGTLNSSDIGDVCHQLPAWLDRNEAGGLCTSNSYSGLSPRGESGTVVFVVEGKRITVSKVKILGNFYFRSMLTSGMKESSQREIELHNDIRYDIFKLVLQYMESEKRDCHSFLTEENDLELLAASDLLQINDLSMDCFSFLLASISPQTPVERMIDILQASLFYRLPQLEEAVLFQFQHMGLDQAADQQACSVAIQKGYHDVAVLLIRKLGSKWHHRHALYCDEFLLSIEKGFSLEFVQLLLENSYDPRKTLNANDQLGNTALHIVCAKGLPSAYQILDVLISNGPDVDRKNETGSTPLVIAVVNNRFELVQLLLQSGANPNIPDKRGNTPLHIAVECKFFTIVQLLLKYNDTNLEAKNLQNQKPLAPLITHGVPFLLELLRAWHGTPTALRANCNEGDEQASDDDDNEDSDDQMNHSRITSPSPIRSETPSPSSSAGERLLFWLASRRCFHLVGALLECTTTHFERVAEITLLPIVFQTFFQL
ncbi:hypothetical protein Pelo_1921 [Pelomyxa schiedti]|nr:hypothetical protein Pelo_1921 [Pelomyxa schiedti]